MLEELSNPSEILQKFLPIRFTLKVTAKVVDQFSGIVKRSLNQMISDLISDRLKSALAKETDMAALQAKPNEPPVMSLSKLRRSRINTTELEGSLSLL